MFVNNFFLSRYILKPQFEVNSSFIRLNVNQSISLPMRLQCHFSIICKTLPLTSRTGGWGSRPRPGVSLRPRADVLCTRSGAIRPPPGCDGHLGTQGRTGRVGPHFHRYPTVRPAERKTTNTILQAH